MDDNYITPDFVQQPRARNQAPPAAPAAASNFFQENKMMIIIFGVVVVVVICLLLFVMTREKKPDPSKRPPPGNQNGPQPQNAGPPPIHPVPHQHADPPQHAPQQNAPPRNVQPDIVVEERRVSKPSIVAPVIETADDDEVNKYMNLGEENEEDLESSDEKDNIVVKKKVSKPAKKGDFDDLDEYESSD